MRSIIDHHAVDWASQKPARTILDFGHRFSERDGVWSVEIVCFYVLRVDLDDPFRAADADLGSRWSRMVVVVVFPPASSRDRSRFQPGSVGEGEAITLCKGMVINAARPSYRMNDETY